jgi:hypothetical protein
MHHVGEGWAIFADEGPYQGLQEFYGTVKKSTEIFLSIYNKGNNYLLL